MGSFVSAHNFEENFSILFVKKKCQTTAIFSLHFGKKLEQYLGKVFEDEVHCATNVEKKTTHWRVTTRKFFAIIESFQNFEEMLCNFRLKQRSALRGSCMTSHV